MANLSNKTPSFFVRGIWRSAALIVILWHFDDTVVAMSIRDQATLSCPIKTRKISKKCFSICNTYVDANHNPLGNMLGTCKEFIERYQMEKKGIPYPD